MSEETMDQRDVQSLTLERVEIKTLRPHPRNYRQHPPDQIAHIAASLEENGLYRNVVISIDGYISAGHGVVQAAETRGFSHMIACRLPYPHDDPRALKVLTGDNEIAHLGVIDDRVLTDLLKDIKSTAETGLIGTGYDEAMLAGLLFVTRPQSEIENFDEAAEWAGMPEYEPVEQPIKLIVSFASEEDRQDFAERLGVRLTAKSKSMWWPPRGKDDVSSVRFEGEQES